MNYKIFVFIIIAISIFLGCGKNQITNPNAPVLISMYPTTANIGDTITITGYNFGFTHGVNYDSFNLLHASKYLIWSDTLLIFRVPPGATSCKVYVVNGEKSNEVSFILNGMPIPDSVKIGNQIWMTKNLDVDHFRNGDIIPQAKSPIEWSNLKTGAWCYLNNDPANGVLYGKLYNWYAVNDPRFLAPKGWHIPTDKEWMFLVDSLGGYKVAGGKMKCSGSTYEGTGLWRSPNTGATNESNFYALPADFRSYWGDFSDSFLSTGTGTYWWSSSKIDSTTAWSREIFFNDSLIFREGQSKNEGYSIRCVKDK